MYTNEAKLNYVKVYPNKDAIRQMQMKSLKENTSEVLYTQEKNIKNKGDSSLYVNALKENICADQFSDLMLLLCLLFNDYEDSAFFTLFVLCILFAD